MPEALIIDALRTPIGRYGGALAGVRPDDLAARVIEAALDRTGIEGAAVDEVVMARGAPGTLAGEVVKGRPPRAAPAEAAAGPAARRSA